MTIPRSIRASILMLLSAAVLPSAAAEKPNILFIAIDDLRPELGCYGSPIAITPNLDKLASQGLLFNRAYCQEAICSPSRASIMTGARPDKIGIIENYTYFRDSNPDIVTLPQQFRNNGYETVYVGKVFHGKYTDEEKSWSRQPAAKAVKSKFPIIPGGYALPENRKIVAENRKALLEKYGPDNIGGLTSNGPAYESADVPDYSYTDGQSPLIAIETLKDHLQKKPDQPLFLALGFSKPHLHFIAPKKYWDLYDPETIPLAEHSSAPKDGAATGLHASFELRVRDGIPKKGDIDPQLSRTLKHAYLACVSYIDAQVGLMLDALDETGQRDNTIVIVWSDHGWHLGDMGIWGKATNYEIATRVPLILQLPDMKNAAGKKTEALTELIDMYPTLCDLAGIPKPAHLDGKSLVPLLENPEAEIKDFALSQYPNPALREWAANPLAPAMRETFFGPLIEQVEERIIAQMGDKWDRDLFENHLMGYSLRTDRYRYIEWRDHRDPDAEALFTELYDHESDPAETKNVASANPDIVSELSKKLRSKL
ncbi:sulfatase [Luteolibacter algae]|uniref:Sulfatase n=1 Tax=Luteolibacter algae TaxID=454151 RepID=A0ABW5D7S5_9BACT